MAEWNPTEASEMDDIFDECVEEHLIAQREWTKTEDDIKKTGYRLGVSAGEEETLQQGFDAGYRDTAPAAFTIGQLLGQISATLTLQGANVLARETTQTAEDRTSVLNALAEDCTNLLRALVHRQKEQSVKFAATCSEHCVHAKSANNPEAQHQHQSGEVMSPAAGDIRELTRLLGSCNLQDWPSVSDPSLRQTFLELLSRCEVLMHK